jgi:hypothetical protein
MIALINPSSPIQLVQGDTALGVEIDEPNWDCTGASATFVLEDFNGNAIPPFSGQSATIAQASAPTKLQYAWPSALPAGGYIAHFEVTFANGGVLATEGVLIQVAPA